MILTGPTGTGKTFLACAVGTNACRGGYRVRYYVAAKLFRLLRSAHADGSHMRLSDRLTKTDLLIIDDWGMETLKASDYPADIIPESVADFVGIRNYSESVNPRQFEDSCVSI